MWNVLYNSDTINFVVIKVKPAGVSPAMDYIQKRATTRGRWIVQENLGVFV